MRLFTRCLIIRAALAVTVLGAGCAAKTDGARGSCEEDFLPGDLVISEVFADPAGDDAGKEWFEIYNAGDKPVSLEGLTLVASKNDKTGEKTHVMRAVMVGAGGYLVVGGVTDDLKPAHVDYGYGNDLSSLRNSDARLALSCGGVIIDEMTYATASSATSRGFTGAVASPDAAANDDENKWCDAKTEYETGSKGSPGEPNEACKPTGQPTDCLDGATTRPLVPPAAGDLVISEWMADPSKSEDAKGEWFEVTVLRDVDLNGVEIGTVPPKVLSTVNDAKCLRATAGKRLLFARTSEAGMNGMLPAVDYTYTFGLGNTGGTIFVGAAGVVFDQISYTKATAGTSTQVDPSKVDAAANDDPANACNATTVYGAGDKGTPGAANTACSTTMPTNQCNDGGTLRDIVVPAVGDLIISEVMPHSAKVGDDVGEWFEVAVTRNVDLNGVQLSVDGVTPKLALSSPDCLKAAAGSFLVFGRNDDPTMNGGLPALSFVFNFNLVNDARAIALLRGGALLDLANYPKPLPAAGGVASSLPPSKLNATDNDTATNFCAATEAYGLGDKGTPGKANPACP